MRNLSYRSALTMQIKNILANNNIHIFSSLYFFFYITVFDNNIMMKYKKLPNEVLRHIFQYMPRKTIYQCILVCKA
jgi:uncharacterized membrane protein